MGQAQRRRVSSRLSSFVVSFWAVVYRLSRLSSPRCSPLSPHRCFRCPVFSRFSWNLSTKWVRRRMAQPPWRRPRKGPSSSFSCSANELIITAASPCIAKSLHFLSSHPIVPSSFPNIRDATEIGRIAQEQKGRTKRGKVRHQGILPSRLLHVTRRRQAKRRKEPREAKKQFQSPVGFLFACPDAQFCPIPSLVLPKLFLMHSHLVLRNVT
jgi:hypothetical protein